MLESADQKLSPLVVGVSGHRDIRPDCIEHAKAEVTEFLAALQSLAPHTPIRVMAGMADGADMLVAEAALERRLPVDAVLPMPLEDYAEDFDSESLARLHRLLEHPDVRLAVLAPPSGDLSDRDELYANLTEALIRKTTVLVALWDGEYSPLRGGTGDTVLKYLEAHAGSAPATPLTFIDDTDDITWGPQAVFWVSVSRQSAPEKPCEGRRYLSGIGEHMLLAQAEMPTALRNQIVDLDRYNAEFERLHRGVDPPKLDTLMGDLPYGISTQERANLRAMDKEYGKADALAVYCQHHSHRLFRWFSYMASVMGLLFLVYAKLIPSKIFLLAYLVVLLAGIGLFQVTKSRHWFSKHLAYRVLAETMRTKFFLRLSTADRRVNTEDLFELAGIDQFKGFGWIINVLKNVDPLTDPQNEVQTQVDRNLEAVRQIWIEGQQSYFRAKVARLERTHHRLEQLKTGLLLALALITVVLVLFGGALGGDLLEAGFSSKDLLMFLMGLLPVWLGIWELYQGKMATRELLWQYRNLLGHFSRAKIQLSQAGDRDRRTSILADLGRDSLMESYLWTIHRYHREHEPPAAG